MNSKIFAILVFAFFGFSILGLSQEVVVSPLTPAPTSIFDTISAMLATITNVIVNHPYASIGTTIVAEILGRLIKTEKPLGVISGVGRILGSLGGLFMALDGVVSKVIPQRLKPPV